MLKRLCASFSIACLIFSVSVLPCLAEEWGDSIAVTASVGDRDSSTNQYYHATFPFSGRTIFYSSDAATFTKQPLTVTSALYAPVEYDRTMILSVGIQNNTAGYDSWFNGVDQYVNSPSVFYADSRMDGSETSGLVEYPDGVQEANDVYEVYGEAGEIFNFQVVIPAYSNSFEFSTAGFVTFTTEASPWHIVSYGGYIIETADHSILGVVEQILADTSSIDGNIANIVTAINDILIELRSIGADTSTIVTLLNGLTDLSERQLNTLENVASNVEAIYYFLTEELKDKAEATDQVVSDTATQIENQHMAEDFYMTNMDSEYKKLQLDQVSLSGVTGGLSLVSALFQDVWTVIGKWQIVYTFPLTLGIALLVIGRIAKSERKESTSEEVSSAPRASVNPRHNHDNRGARNG